MAALFRHKAAYKTIGLAAEHAILSLHREHPEMGRKRLYEALDEQGVHVDEQELKRFLRSHHIGTPPAIGQARPPFGWSRVPHIPWLKYRK